MLCKKKIAKIHCFLLTHPQITTSDLPPQNNLDIRPVGTTVGTLEVLDDALKINPLVISKAYVISIGFPRAGEVDSDNAKNSNLGQQERKIRDDLYTSTSISV